MENPKPNSLLESGSNIDTMVTDVDSPSDFSDPNPTQMSPGVESSPDEESSGESSLDEESTGESSPDEESTGVESPNEESTGVESPNEGSSGVESPDEEPSGGESPDEESSDMEYPDWLPPGWCIKFLNEKYYVDPVSKHLFQSKEEVLSYLDTGVIGNDEDLNDGSDAESAKVSIENFDYNDPPKKVKWVMTDFFSASWRAEVADAGGADVVIPMSTQKEWAAAFIHMAQKKNNINAATPKTDGGDA